MNRTKNEVRFLQKEEIHLSPCISGKRVLYLVTVT